MIVVYKVLLYLRFCENKFLRYKKRYIFGLFWKVYFLRLCSFVFLFKVVIFGDGGSYIK